MNVQYDLIQELILNEFKLGPNIMGETEKIYCAKVKDTVDQNIVTKLFQETLLGLQEP